MRHIKLKMIFAWLAVLSIAMTGAALAQPTMPSLVTQQTRLSTGGGTPNYVQLRAKAGVPSSANAYFWDQAPNPTAGTNYSMMLDQNNNIELSTGFGPTIGAPPAGFGQPFYLERVNAAGTGLEWVQPGSLVTANNGIFIDNTTTPGSPIVQLGGAATATNPLLVDRFVTLGGHALNFDGAGSFNVGTPTTVVNMTFDPGLTGFITLNDIGTSLTTTKFVTLDATNHVITRDLSTLVVADNGLTINAVGGFVELGGAATNTAPLLVDRFVSLGGKTMNWEGSGNFNIGDGTGVQAIKIDPSATGSVTVNNLPTTTPAAATDKFVYLDGTTNKASTRTLSSLISANNGIVIDNTTVAGQDIVQLGGTATNTNPLTVNRFVTLGGQALNFDGSGTFNVGTAGGVVNMTFDPGATGFITLADIIKDNTLTSMVVVDPTGKVHTRDITSLVSADNGLSINPVGGIVELGGPLATPSALLNDRYVSMSTFALNFTGAGAFKIGDGTAALNTTIDVGAAGALTLNNLPTTTPAAATDKFVYLDGTTNKASTRTLSSLVSANNGIVIDNTTVAGQDIVQLGGTVTGTNPLTANRFVTLGGQALNFDGSGSFNVSLLFWLD